MTNNENYKKLINTLQSVFDAYQAQLSSEDEDEGWTEGHRAGVAREDRYDCWIENEYFDSDANRGFGFLYCLLHESDIIK